MTWIHHKQAIRKGTTETEQIIKKQNNNNPKRTILKNFHKSVLDFLVRILFFKWHFITLTIAKEPNIFSNDLEMDFKMIIFLF